MAKRFTDTKKWEKKWFRSLTNTQKVFWNFILDHCDHAGIWDVDFDFASIFCGELNETEIREVFKKQYAEIANGKQWFIKDFVEFQYGDLNPNNNLHRSVLTILQKAGAIQPLNSPCSGAKDKDKVKDKEKESIYSDKFTYLNDAYFKSAYDDYLTMRKAIKKPMTPRAEKMALEELHKHPIQTAVKMMEQSVFNSWAGIFPLKNNQALASKLPPKFGT